MFKNEHKIRFYKKVADSLKTIMKEWDTPFPEEEIREAKVRIINICKQILVIDGLLTEEGWWKW